MPHTLRNALGHPYLTISYDAPNDWIYNEWQWVISI